MDQFLKAALRLFLGNNSLFDHFEHGYEDQER